MFSKRRKNKKNNVDKQADKKPVERPDLGKVYFGKTKYIEKDTKPRRRYVVIYKDDSRAVKVSKLKSLKKFNEDGKNTNPHLMEIDYTKYPPLTTRTGVDSQVFTQNRHTKEKLKLGKGNGVFDDTEQFTLDKEDYAKAKTHVVSAETERRKKMRKKKKGK